MTRLTEPRRLDWWARPAIVLPAVAALLFLVVLLTPQSTSGRVGDDRLSAHLAGSLGARGLKEVATRFGWRTVLRDSAPTPAGARGGTVHAVLAPPLTMTPAQAHRYLEAVRAGDALLLVLGRRDPLGDSLGLRHSDAGGQFTAREADTEDCGPGADFTPPLWPDGNVHLWALRWVRGRPHDAVDFATVEMPVKDSATVDESAASGFALGKGRVVAVSDPDLLRNDVLRRCGWGADAAAMRMLEWLRAGGDQPRSTIEFDEFHQGYGPTKSPTSVAARFLRAHPVGRTILQGVLAALVLLLALAPRPIVPRARARAERRDPLEQADALAHAYQQVRATRTATQRLLRGVRARVGHAGGRGRTGDDDAFLALARDTDPARADDVALVRRALASPGGDDALPEIGAALRRIELSLTITPTAGR